MFKTIRSHIRLHFLVLAESIMASRPPFDAVFLFPDDNHDLAMGHTSLSALHLSLVIFGALLSTLI